MRGATQSPICLFCSHSNFNPRAPCGARLRRCRDPGCRYLISTHAPLAGRDCSWSRRSSRAAGFQPTRPLRGATYVLQDEAPPLSDFNPRAPCGARRWCGVRTARTATFQPTRPLRGATQRARKATRLSQISTHAPLAGRDSRKTAKELYENRFQPTRPLRGATQGRLRARAQMHHFNPRAPCGARRPFCRKRLRFARYFNPRAPCGARRSKRGGGTRRKRGFQPTRPLRGATRSVQCLRRSDLFQPTRPLRGATMLHAEVEAVIQFQPTRPLRGATLGCTINDLYQDISTHAPLAGRDTER